MTFFNQEAISRCFSFEFTVRKQDITVFQSKKGSLAVSRIIFGKIRADIRGNLS